MAKLKAPIGGCTIRMYRPGLGDCFLLAFGISANKQKYVLIDCGVLLGTTDAEQHMKAIAKDIQSATSGKLDVLVVTHEHWDHVSGFIYAQDIFAQLKIDQVWLPWTENPRNPLARELRERRRAGLQGLRTALTKSGTAPQGFTNRIESLAAFYGPNELGVSGRAKTEDALDWVKNQWTKPKYCKPGGVPLELEGLEHVRFYVLGPPEDAKFIRKSRPSSRGDQVYLDDMFSGQLGFYLTALDATPQQEEIRITKENFSPFNKAYHRLKSDQEVTEIDQLYESDKTRKIDTDWTAMAGELALKLDAHTNNTSLVLAIELAPDDKVMLFPGDAQVGNWLYWDQVKWSGDYESITAANLLSRTVLYKVGHHGSHNATLRELGLERMTHEDLVALIPVDREMATKRQWRMPHEPLYDRLKEKTLGRVVLTDIGLPIATSDEVLDTFLQQCKMKKLYVDYKIESWNK